jgi:hypothetical protein
MEAHMVRDDSGFGLVMGWTLGIVLAVGVLATGYGLVTSDARHVPIWLTSYRFPQMVRAYQPSPDSSRTIGDVLEYYKHPSFGITCLDWRTTQVNPPGTYLVSLNYRSKEAGTETLVATWKLDAATGLVTAEDLGAAMFMDISRKRE